MKNRIRRIMTVLLTLTLMSADVGTIAESIIHTLTLPKALQIIEEDHYHTTFTERFQRIDAITKLAKALGTVNRGEKRDAVMN